MYDGSSIVARSVARGQPVIFASMNYRLNAFGFLPGKEARGEDVSTNAGESATWFMSLGVSSLGCPSS